MPFDSVTFWLFFPIAWCAWRFLPFHLSRTVLAGLSLVFYAWWNPLYVPLLLGSAALDYQIGKGLVGSTNARTRRALVTTSIVVNIGVLCVFKYTPLAFETFDALAGRASDPLRFATWTVPVGISFYTFQTLSYTIDLYRGRTQPARSLRDFVLYVAFFPQLVAGPIVRARTFLPQLDARAPLEPSRFQYGLYRCIEGLFLKIVIADGLATAVERCFDTDIGGLTPVGAWVGATLFGGQIYADFAGYSGIAIGIACLLGLRFPENFRAPYIARSLSDFWRRWHITLSSWLRDYLYVPLGGNRRGRARTDVNLMATMLLGGLWHGASWTFVLWGGLHGAGLVVGKGAGAALGGWRGRSRAFVSFVLVFAFVQVTWVFFRSTSFERAIEMCERMLVAPITGDFAGRAPEWRTMVLLAPIALQHLFQHLHETRRVRRSAMWRGVAAGLMLFALVVVRRSETYQFLYFQF